MITKEQFQATMLKIGEKKSKFIPVYFNGKKITRLHFKENAFETADGHYYPHYAFPDDNLTQWRNRFTMKAFLYGDDK
jgi:hypothetical protein